MRKRILLMVLLPALLPAQEKRALTIDEAVRLGLQNSRILRISEARATAAEAQSDEADAARLPSVKLYAGYTRVSDVDPFAVKLPSSPAPVVISPTVLDQYTSRVSVQQPLFTGFRLAHSAAAADYAAKASQLTLKRDRVETAYTVRAAYWSAYKAMEAKRVVDENVEQMSAHVADVKNLLAQGLLTRNEVLKVEVQLSVAQLAQIEAANAVTNATMALNNLIGLPLNTEIRIASDARAVADSRRAADALIPQAVASRTDVQSAEMRVKAAEASVAAVNGGWWPQISLFADAYYSRPNPRIMPTQDQFKSTWDAGVSLSWDIWNWGTTKHQSERAEAVQSQTRYALEQLKDNASLEVTRSHLSLQQARERVVVAVKAVEQAEENYRLTKSKFTSGTATNTDLLDAEAALLQARMSHAVSLADHEVADAALLKALDRED